MKLKSRSFTLVEMLIVIVVIGILATLVTVAFTNASKKSSDRKAVADVNTIASGLDQYSLSKGRVYPKPANCNANICHEEITSSSAIYSALANKFVNSMATSNSSYKLYYATNATATKAAVSIGPAKTSNICNRSGSIPLTASHLRTLVDNISGSSQTFCYYVAK